MADFGFDPVIGALNTSLNLREVNQNVISSNIANDETPGYKAKRVDFEGAFREALGRSNHISVETTDAGHRAPHETDPVNPEIFDDPNGVESMDGNTVNRSDENVRMAENQILYEASVDLMRKKLGMLKYAATDGGGGNQ